jgi:putative phosphoesterase
MKLGIISDTHDRAERVAQALAEFRRRGVERIVHCGDVTGPRIVQLFDGWTADFVLGNCDWDPGGLERAMTGVGATLHQPFGELELAGRRIAWIHSHDERLFQALEYADHYDYLFYGHTHVAEQHRTGKTLVVNPGALHRARVKQCGVLDTETGIVETVVLTDTYT